MDKEQPTTPVMPQESQHLSVLDATRSSTGLGEWLKQLVTVVHKEKVEERFAQQIDSAGLQKVTIQTTNGAVDYVGDAQNQTMTIQVHKLVKAPDLATAEAFADQVEIHVEPLADTLRIYHTYPKPPRQVEVTVSFMVNGPPHLAVNGRSTNGHVAIRQVEGAVQAESTNGEIQLTTISGAITARCTNGTVKAKQLTLTAASAFHSQNGDITVESRQARASITATTVNGSVRLTLPPDYQGRLDARTQNGQVRTAFRPQITTRARNRLVGQIGGGSEALLKLQSQNGDVTLAVATA